MNNKIDNLNSKIDNLSNKVDQLLEIIANLNENTASEIGEIVETKLEVKVQKFNIDNESIKEYLEMNNTKGDLALLEHLYFLEEEDPIRLNSSKNIEYWFNKRWNINNGELINTLLHNMKTCYLTVNTFDNYNDEPDTFMKNQKYIMELSNEKSKERLLKSLKQFLEKRSKNT